MTEHIPTILRSEMERQNLTYAKLCELSGLSISTIADTIRGHAAPRINTVVALLKGLGKSLTWLEREMKAAAKEDSVVVEPV